MELIVVNGFLGSGKTTLIQRFLQDAQTPFPVIVNEFGKTTYDADRLGRLSDAVTSIHHGSIFCTCKAPEFIDVLSKLLREGHDRILVESSGFADPSAMDGLIVQAMNQAKIESVGVSAISLVDPSTFMKLIGSMAMLRKQVECADVILIHKTDIATLSQIEELRTVLKQLNPHAVQLTGSYGNFDRDRLRFHSLSIQDPIHRGSKKDISSSELTVVCGKWKDLPTITSFLREVQPYLLRLKGTIRTDDQGYRIEIAGISRLIEMESEITDEIVMLYSAKESSSQDILETLHRHHPQARLKP